MRRARLVAVLFLSGCLLNACGSGSSAPPAVTHLSVTVPSATVTAGTSFNMTVSALNDSGLVVTTYAGTVHFASSDQQAILPVDSTLTNGTGTFSVTLHTVGSQTITVTDTAKASITGTSSSINVSLVLPNGIVGQAYGVANSISINGSDCQLSFFGWWLSVADVPTHWSWSAAPGSLLPPGLTISNIHKTCGLGPSLTTLFAAFVGGVPTTAGTYNVILTGGLQESIPNTINIVNAASASDAKDVSALPQHHHYKLVEIPTFGGPNNYFTVSNRTLNNSGVAAGTADTPTAANPPFCLLLPDCFVPHSFVWKDDRVTDLGGLPGVAVSGSLPNYINDKDVVTGIAFNGGVDEAIGVPQFDAVVWKDGQVIDLGTFGGNLSYAAAINDQDEAVGFALNSTPASFDLGDWCQNFPMPTEMRAFIWRNGVKQDLGTLGGTDSCALVINERGQVAGHSFTDTIVNPSTGLPTLHPFLWNGNKMMDLGTLGGTMAITVGLNNRGQVAGLSWLAGDQIDHPFLWDSGKLTDLGSLGGDNAEVIGFNEAGHVVGKSDLAGPLPQLHHAFLASTGGIIDLGTQDGDPCSIAFGINSHDQVVGASSDCFNSLHAFLWEHGQMIDLNAFVPGSSKLTLTEATFINDRGEIAAEGVLPNGDQRAVLLIPCDEQHPDVEGCDYSLIDLETSIQTYASPTIAVPENGIPENMKDRIRSLLKNRNSRF